VVQSSWAGINDAIVRELGQQKVDSVAGNLSSFPFDRTPEILFSIDDLSTSQLIFLLMPFRHGIDQSSKNGANESLDYRRAQLRMVLKILDARDDAIDAEAKLVQRFRKQSQRSLNAADDRAKAPTGLISEETNVSPSSSIASISNYDDLLERLPFQSDESRLELGDDKLLQTLDGFLSKHLVRKSGDGSHTAIAISLSGGVDSMVLLKVTFLTPSLFQKSPL